MAENDHNKILAHICKRLDALELAIRKATTGVTLDEALRAPVSGKKKG